MPKSRGRSNERKKGGTQTPHPEKSFLSLLRQILETTWGRVWATVAAIVTLGGLFSIAERCLEAYRNTSPEVHLSGQEPSEPFLLPFSVKNNSQLFEMKDVEFYCATRGDGLQIGNLTFSNLSFTQGLPKTTIPPMKFVNFRCPVTNAKGPLVKGTIHPIVKYRTLLFKRNYEGQDFTWYGTATPPRWIEGDLPR
jgi:hypothetical protein